MGTEQSDILWGFVAIGREVGLSHKAVKPMVEAGQLPATKVGDRWCSSRVLLRKKLLGALDDKRR
jgi:hypothetical protein